MKKTLSSLLLLTLILATSLYARGKDIQTFEGGTSSFMFRWPYPGLNIGHALTPADTFPDGRLKCGSPTRILFTQEVDYTIPISVILYSRHVPTGKDTVQLGPIIYLWNHGELDSAFAYNVFLGATIRAEAAYD